MNNFVPVIDLGSSKLRLSVFDEGSQIIYSSHQKVNNNFESINLENSLSKLIRDAEKSLSVHLDNVTVLYDSSQFYTLDISIKKVFDQPTSINKVYKNLIDEANFIISQNNFKDQVMHLIVNEILINDKEKLVSIIEDIKITSLILELKFICLKKTLVKYVSNIFKKNNLNISNLYCSSYIKTIFYKKNFDIKNLFIFCDIGYERSSVVIFYNKKLEVFNSIPIGGNSVTKDISKILKLSLDYSEELKVKLNINENELEFNKNNLDGINPYIEIFDKNISLDLLKQIISARVEEIINLSIKGKKYIDNFNVLEKPNLILFGSGSKSFSNSYRLNIDNAFSDLIFYDENDSKICEAGLNYKKSEESSLIQIKKKVKKKGFFESFFNLFSK